MEDRERNKALMRRFVEEVINGGHLEVADELISPDHVNHDPTAPDHEPGREGLKQLIAAYRRAFPDLRFEIQEMVAEGDSVALLWTLTGTHRGELMDIPPTGRSVHIYGSEINHFEDGLITESWAVSDALTLMRQIGHPPGPDTD